MIVCVLNKMLNMLKAIIEVFLIINLAFVASTAGKCTNQWNKVLDI